MDISKELCAARSEAKTLCFVLFGGGGHLHAAVSKARDMIDAFELATH